MPYFKSFINTLFFAITFVVVTSCVPKATEKKAVCGTNEAFNNVTRACFSISETRAKPFGTKSSDALLQETAKEITLTYIDANNNPAISCKVTTTNSGLVELMSPVLTNGSLFNRADEVSASANDIAGVLTTLGSGAAAGLATDMQTALNNAKTSFNYSFVISEMGDFKTNALALVTLAETAPFLANVNARYFKELTTERLDNFESVFVFLKNSCECTAGICKTTVVPRIGISGVAGFSYTISDEDGEGNSKGVSLSITPTAATVEHLKPAVQSGFFTVDENSVFNSITLPGASNLASQISSNFIYSLVSATGGAVSNCLANNSDLICTFTPSSADYFDNPSIVVTKASATIGTLGNTIILSAKEFGVSGNNVTVQVLNLQENNLSTDTYLTPVQKFGMIDPSSEAFIRVYGNDIKIFINPGITSLEQVRTLLASHPKVSRMLEVPATVTGSPIFLLQPMASASSFVGGFGVTNTITYRAAHSSTPSVFSTNSAKYEIRVNPLDDKPLVAGTTIPVTSNPIILEDAAVATTISLPFTDVDDIPGGPLSCTVDFATIPNNAGLTYETPTICSCNLTLRTCSVNVVPTANFNGVAQFSYIITTKDQFSLATQPTLSQSVLVSVTAVNDAPSLVINSAFKIVSPATLGADADNFPAMPYTVTTPESSTMTPSSGYVCLTAIPGGGIDEASQTLTLTVTPSRIAGGIAVNFAPVKAPNIPGNVCAAGQFMVPFSTPLNLSSITPMQLSFAVSDGQLLNSTNLVEGSFPPVSVPGTANLYYWDNIGLNCYRSIDAATWSALLPAPFNIKANCRTSVDLVVTVTDDPAHVLAFDTIVETNEGGTVQSDAFWVDEDIADSSDENTQQMRLVSISSDNNSVLPITAIKVFYDENDNGVEDIGEIRVIPGVLESSAAINARSHKFYLKLDPIDGVSGNANVSIVVDDSTPANQKTITFSFVVNPVAALHGGWSNISATGLKTDKNGAPVAEADIVCNYNKTTDLNKCGSAPGSNCIGSTAPNGSVVPQAADVIYFDSANKRCYRSTDATAFGWTELKTNCPITRTTGVCSGNNCMYNNTPLIKNIKPTAKEQYYYNYSSNTCYVSTDENVDGFDDANDWEVYSPSKVTLAWNFYTITGSGADSGVFIAGWNVYRREAGKDYDFKTGHLRNSTSTSVMTITDSSIRTFTDITAIAGKVYYYVVRPVDSRHNFPTFTPEIFSEIRIVAPPANYTFVHRWMANQEVCNSMNMTTTTPAPNRVDPTKNYRCPYKGPGDTLISGTRYYDIGKDMLVDMQEMGCPYSAAPTCGTGNGCVGITDPDIAVVVAVADGSIYYNRNSGSCFIRDSGAWVTFQSASKVATAPLTAPTSLVGLAGARLQSALNPPIVNITAAQAAATCATRPAPAFSWPVVTAGVPYLALQNAVLPEKKEYIAFSGHPKDITDSIITDTEQGFSLNVQSRCNSSSASGIDNAYTDSVIPSTSFIYSIPGTASSGIRSLYTGSIPWVNSKSTEACVSRYGIQDLYGNVKEWVRDRMNCNGSGAPPGTAYTCNALSGTDLFYDMYNVWGGLNYYGYDLTTGPFNDADANLIPSGTDGYLTQWLFSEQLFGAGKFSLPLALPIHSDIDDSETAGVGALLYNSLLDIGPGISTNRLHDDAIIINSEAVVNGGGVGAIAVGGSYLSGTAAGRFTSELIPQNSVSVDTGFRCMIPIESTTGSSKYPGDGAHTYPY